jgi:hypothetical protein
MGPSKDRREEAADIRRQDRARQVLAAQEAKRRADEAAAKAAKRKGE